MRYKISGHNRNCRTRYRPQPVFSQSHCSNCTIRKICPAGFDGIRPSQSSQNEITKLILPPHEAIYNTATNFEYVYIITRGHVKLWKQCTDGYARIICILERGDVFGLEGIITNRYEQSATTVSQSTVCKIPKKIIYRDGSSPISLALRGFNRLNEKLVAGLVEYCTGTAKQRIARFFLHARPDGDGLLYLFGREPLSQLLGLSIETTSRVIAEMKRTGAIKEIQQGVFERNLNDLKQLAAFRIKF